MRLGEPARLGDEIQARTPLERIEDQLWEHASAFTGKYVQAPIMRWARVQGFSLVACQQANEQSIRDLCLSVSLDIWDDLVFERAFSLGQYKKGEPMNILASLSFWEACPTYALCPQADESLKSYIERLEHQTDQAQEAREALLKEMRMQENSPEELRKLRCMTNRLLVSWAIERSLKKVSRKITQAQSQEYELESEKLEKLARSYKVSLRADILPYALVYAVRKSSKDTDSCRAGKVAAMVSGALRAPGQSFFEKSLAAGVSMLGSEARVGADASIQRPPSDQLRGDDDVGALLEEVHEQELMDLLMTIMASGVAGTMGRALGDDLTSRPSRSAAQVKRALGADSWAVAYDGAGGHERLAYSLAGAFSRFFVGVILLFFVFILFDLLSSETQEQEVAQP